ncbi:MAG TPA: 50S ribosomal protein L23 [Candidatus Deferrimicrobium sp.]|nr:50S ribosomal protein L23 [Candidatus Deferrimicrobium sp.]
MIEPHSIIVQPVMSESAFEMLERENKLTFIVRRTANKHLIKWAVKKLYEVKVDKINTLILPDGRKKAFVRLSPESNAADVATRLNIF